MQSCMPKETETEDSAFALSVNRNGNMCTQISPNSKPMVARLGGLSQTIALATALCGGLATAGFAQTENTVTLKYQGGEDITGEFLEVANGMVKIDSAIGMIAIPLDGLSCVGAACPDGTHIELAGEPVTLTSKVGNVSLSGHLIDIVDGQYVLATNIGEIKIDTDTVNCAGVDCLPQEGNDEVPFAFGGKVTLVGGSARLEGILTDFVDGAFVVETENLGLVRVSSDSYTCEGEGCP